MNRPQPRDPREDDPNILHLEQQPEMPDADTLAHLQVVDAVWRIHQDTSKYAQFPWRELAQHSGPMCPQDLVMVAARTGGGKSLFLQNLFDSLVVAGRTCLYIGLEQSPDILRTKWACLRSDVAPKTVLATRPADRGGAEWNGAMDRVQNELEWQRTPAIVARAHFAAARKINAVGLQRWTTWGVDRGCTVVIVDHIDRVQHGEGRNPFHEVSETIRLAKELAAEYGITMILASQVGRPGDPLERFMPPGLHNMRGAGTKEEESDTVLGVYRPLRSDVKDEELKRVRQGLAEADSITEPNIMGVMLLKHRLDGLVAGKVVKLQVRHQRVLELEERDRWTTEDGYPRQIVR